VTGTDAAVKTGADVAAGAEDAIYVIFSEDAAVADATAVAAAAPEAGTTEKIADKQL